jgi:hypothetical protein
MKIIQSIHNPEKLILETKILKKDSSINSFLFLDNISFFEIIDNKIYASYRKIIKITRIELDISTSEFEKFILSNKTPFKKFGNYIINLNKVIGISEDFFEDKVQLEFLFELEVLNLEVGRRIWLIWKQTIGIK